MYILKIISTKKKVEKLLYQEQLKLGIKNIDLKYGMNIELGELKIDGNTLKIIL